MLGRRVRCFSSLFSQNRSINFRTSEATPSLHNEHQLGLFYTINPETSKQLFTHGGLPGTFAKQAKTFTETSLMVRMPALDIMNCIKNSPADRPSIRYVLYGENGTGKSMTLAHLLHFAHVDGYLIVHVPWVSEWLRRVKRNKEMSNSASKEGFVDIPIDAAAWLVHFKTQNKHLLKNPDLVTSREWVWSKREVTPAGSSLAQLVEHGVNRVKFASEVIEALLSEIKLLSNQNKCKAFVAVDGFNCFFYPTTRLRTPTKKKVLPSEVTLTKPFLDITSNDWNNSVIVVTVDQVAVPEDRHESYFPRYLLYKEGFEHLDPFVPVEVKRYTEKEYLSCIAYYRDRLWLRGPAEIDTELKFTSALNPYQLMEQCAPL